MTGSVLTYNYGLHVILTQCPRRLMYNQTYRTSYLVMAQVLFKNFRWGRVLTLMYFCNRAILHLVFSGYCQESFWLGSIALKLSYLKNFTSSIHVGSFIAGRSALYWLSLWDIQLWSTAAHIPTVLVLAILSWVCSLSFWSCISFFLVYSLNFDNGIVNLKSLASLQLNALWGCLATSLSIV